MKRLFIYIMMIWVLNLSYKAQASLPTSDIPVQQYIILPPFLTQVFLYLNVLVEALQALLADQINMYDFLIANSPDPNLLSFILDQASLDITALNGQRGLVQLLLDRDSSME